MAAEVNALALVTTSQMDINLSRTASLTGTAFDTIDYEGICRVIQVAATPTAGSSPTWDGKITSCATSGGTYADVPGATFTQVTSTGNVQGIAIDLSKCERFLKYVGTLGGTSTPTYAVGTVFEGIKKVR